jgi:hypothetical protein
VEDEQDVAASAEVGQPDALELSTSRSKSGASLPVSIILPSSPLPKADSTAALQLLRQVVELGAARIGVRVDVALAVAELLRAA